MAAREQIEMVLAKMEKARPDDFFRKIDETQTGIFAVLRLLNESGETVIAGRISDALNVSTARVAVLLKKMAAKGLIIKEKSARDGRSTVVKLTEQGQKQVSEMQSNLYAKVSYVIDTVGEERVLEFIAIAGEIRAALKEPRSDF